MDKILIATDFSPVANNAVNYGSDLAKFFSAEIVLLHAFTPPFGVISSFSPIQAITEMQTAGYEALNEVRNNIIRRTGFDPGIECVCEPGSPFGAISEFTNKHRVDLVVMGIVGQAGSLKKQVIGSSSISAARNLELPLLIVPEKTSYTRINRISFACDLDHTGDTTLIQSARAFSKAFDAELEIVHVVSKNTVPAETARSTRQIENTLQSVDHKLVSLKNEDVSGALEQYFHEHRTDMVMVNPKKHHIFQNLFMPGTTQKLAFQLKIPLLAIH